jgi:hypothetical protein
MTESAERIGRKFEFHRREEIIMPRFIKNNMGHETLFECAGEADKNALRKHLDDLFGITDEDPLWEALNRSCRSYDEYDTFRSFWAGRPEFDLSDLSDGGGALRPANA